MSGDVDILIVDDRPEDMVAICAVLASAEYNLIRARSGSEALRCVLERDFAVILLDVVMPDFDGFEVARIVKQRERSRLTPIIFLTGATEDVSVIYKGYSLGAVDYLKKPLDPDVLRAKVAIFAELFRKDRRILEQSEALRLADKRAREREVEELKLTSQARYLNLAESIPQIVWMADAEGQLTYVNQRWADYTALEPNDARGVGWLKALHPDDARFCERKWWIAVQAETTYETECRLRGRDEKYRWYLCRATPERERDGRVVGWLGTYTDFDDRKRAFDAAERAIRARDEFLSIASHELRTPLMTLELRLQNLRAEVEKELGQERGMDLSRRVDVALRQSSRLMGLVDDLLDVTQMSAGRLTIRRDEIDLVELTKTIVAVLAESAEVHQSTLRLTAPPTLLGLWDRSRIEQVLHNLIGNALKYAPKSTVNVVVEGNEAGARVHVIDRGIGIEPESQERIFGVFERGVSSRNYGGLGLGLYISRQIAAAHGGEITVRSEVGKGATFTLTLPNTAFDGAQVTEVRATKRYERARSRSTPR